MVKPISGKEVSIGVIGVHPPATLTTQRSQARMHSSPPRATFSNRELPFEVLRAHKPNST